MCYTILFVCAIVLSFGFRETLAMRPLELGEKLVKNTPSFQSLPKGGDKPPSPNPCTFIPGRSHGRCTLSQMNNVAEHQPLPHHAAANPVATRRNQKQGPRS